MSISFPPSGSPKGALPLMEISPWLSPRPTRNGVVPFAIDRKGHRRCVDAAAGVELPEFLQRLGVKRHHFAGWLTAEDEVGRRQDASQIRERRFHFAGDLAGGHIDRCHAAGDLERLARATAGPELPRLQFVRQSLPRP